MANIRKKNTRPISLGYDVIYPPGCKEISDDLRPDDLKRRLKDLWTVLTKMSDTLPDDGEMMASTNDSATLSYLEDLKSSNLERKNKTLRGLLLYLLSEQYTQHNDQDVKLRVGACLCSIARIYCPDSPFEGMEDSAAYKKNFLIFIINCIKQMSKLKSKEDPNYLRLYSIFSVCCQIDLFVWTLCVDDGQDLLHEVFRTVFYIMRNHRVWSWLEETKMKAVVHDMLSNLIVHCESIIDTKTVKFFLHCLIEPTRSAEPEQHELAKELLLRNSGHLEYLIHMLIQSALVTGKESENKSVKKEKIKSKKINHDEDPNVDLDDPKDSDEEEEDDDNIGETETKQSGEEYSKGNEFGDDMFVIIYELHSLKESLVAPILPTIEVKLKSSQMQDRKRACRLLAKLFSESNSTLNSMHPTLWEAFLGRFNDIESDVRETCVRLVPQLLKNKSELPRTELLTALKQRAHDPVENVRHLVLCTVGGLAKTFDTNIPDELYSILVDRARDKSLLIRKEVLSSLAGIYKNLMVQTDRSEKLPVILNTLMHMYYQNSTDDRVVVERLFKSAIVPYNQSASERIRLLILAYSLFDEASVKAFQEMLKVQFAVVSLLREIVMMLVDTRNKKMSVLANKDIADKIAKLSAYMPLREKSIEHLKKFFSVVVRSDHSKKFLVKLTSPVCPCNKAAESMKEILKRQCGSVESGALPNSVMSTVKCLLERASPVIFDPEAGQELVMQLVVCRDAGPNSSSKILSDIQNRQSLRLIYAVASYFKETLPHVDLLEYIIGVLTSHMSETNTHIDNSNAFLVEKYCLEILGCILGGGVRLFSDSQLFEQEDVTQAVFKQIVKKSDELFPLLTAFCTQSRSRESDSSTLSKASQESTSSGSRAKKPTSNNHEVPLSQTSSQIECGPVSVTGWWADSKIAKFTVKCLQYLYSLAEKDESFQAKVKSLLNDILEKCIACPKDSPSYIPCLTTLGQFGLLLPQLFSKEINDLLTNDIIPNILWRDSLDSPTATAAATNSKPKANANKKNSNHARDPKESAILADALAAWTSNSELTHLTKIKILSVKLIARWLFGLKSDDKSLSQAIIRLFYNIIVSDGDLTTAGKIGFGEMSRMRLVAASSWLKLAQQQNYIDVIEVKWFQSMAVIIADPCENVRASFLNKLYRGLLKLTLPLEYMAIFCYAAEVPDAKFKQSARQCLHANVARRKEFLNRHPNSTTDSKLLFALLPDNVLPYAVHLLAHDKNWNTIEDSAKIAKIKTCLWFVLEAIVVRGDSFSFLRKLIEKMKHSRDALAPDDEIANQKLYTVCDIALGLVLSKSTNFVLKEYPVEVKLPRTLFARAPSNFLNPEFSQIANGKDGSPPIQFTPNKHKGASDSLIPNQLLKAPLSKKAAAGQSTVPARTHSDAKSQSLQRGDSSKPGPSRIKAPPAKEADSTSADISNLNSPTSSDKSNSPKKRGPLIRVVGLSNELNPVDIVNISPSKSKQTQSPAKSSKQENVSKNVKDSNQTTSQTRPKTSPLKHQRSLTSRSTAAYSEASPKKRGKVSFSSPLSSAGSSHSTMQSPSKSPASKGKAKSTKDKVNVGQKSVNSKRSSNRSRRTPPSDEPKEASPSNDEEQTLENKTSNQTSNKSKRKISAKESENQSSQESINSKRSRNSSKLSQSQTEEESSQEVSRLRKNSRNRVLSQESSESSASQALLTTKTQSRKRKITSSQESEPASSPIKKAKPSRASKPISNSQKSPKSNKPKGKTEHTKQTASKNKSSPKQSPLNVNLKIRSRREASRSAIMDLYKLGSGGGRLST